MCLLLFVVMFLALQPADAQNPIIKNVPAFKAGETLKCNLYFNWKFVWVRAGDASLIIRDTLFNGQKAMAMSLLSSTNSRADKFFKMRDTCRRNAEGLRQHNPARRNVLSARA